jgi:hypothetical protein
MRTLIARDDTQLRRLESSIAVLISRSAAEQNRMAFLLVALERERAELLLCSGHARRRPPAQLPN